MQGIKKKDEIGRTKKDMVIVVIYDISNIDSSFFFFFFLDILLELGTH